MNTDSIAIKKAIISVFDKTNIVEFATTLTEQGTELYSTGGTYKTLVEAGLKVTEIAELTGSGELFDGRVKTLHPKVYAGILAREQDMEQLKELDYHAFDLVCINLYPFAATIAQPGVSDQQIIEMIDIGGPSMLRAAAKNFQRVLAISNPASYSTIQAELINNQGKISAATRLALATETFATIHQYDADISHWFAAHKNPAASTFQSAPIPAGYKLQETLRYGENPHQTAALFISDTKHGLASAQQINGKPMSWNNYTDLLAAWECVQQFQGSACTIIKHANPCGVALGTDQLDAFNKALKTDTTSAFGGIIAFNSPLEVATAKAIIAFGFVEVIVAPEIDQAAHAVFNKRKNLRLLTMQPTTKQWSIQGDENAIMVQSSPHIQTNENWQCVTQAQPTAQQLEDAKFAWKVCKSVKSNAIVYAKNAMTIGVGAGQMSRIFSARIGQLKAIDAELDIAGSVMASDAFFPFRDSVDEAAKVGVSVIVQPGGSIRDEEVIQAANEHNIGMIFTGTRYFFH